MSATVRAATLVALALAALALLIAAPAAGEANATAEAWIEHHYVYPNPPNSSHGGNIIDGIVNEHWLGTNRDIINVTVVMTIYHNSSPIAVVSENHTLCNESYRAALYWQTNQSGIFTSKTELFNQNGTLLDKYIYDDDSIFGELLFNTPGHYCEVAICYLFDAPVYLSIEPRNEPSYTINLTLWLKSCWRTTWEVSMDFSADNLDITPQKIHLLFSPDEISTIFIDINTSTNPSARSENIFMEIVSSEYMPDLGNFRYVITIPVIIQPYSNLSLSAESSERGCPGSTTKLYYRLTNNGNFPDTVYIMIADQDNLENDGFTVALLATSVILEPSEFFIIIVELGIPNAPKLPVNVTVMVRSSLPDIGSYGNASTTITEGDCSLLAAPTLPLSLMTISGAVYAIARRRR